MNYRNEIKRMAARVPQKVRDGSVQNAVAWKKSQEKAIAVARKVRATEAELTAAYADLQRYE